MGQWSLINGIRSASMDVRSIFILCIVALELNLLQAALYPVPHVLEEKEEPYWMKLGADDLQEALRKPLLTGVAKNIILFLGDGMGVTATTAGRIFKGQKEGRAGEDDYLAWERFPNIALLKTYNLDKQVPDSAATATAFLTGVKGNYYTVGVNGRVMKGHCNVSLDPTTHLKSILHWAQQADKDTGFVTTTRVTHATPAGLYAHSAQRNWECDSKVKEAGPDAMHCRDIARQLVEDVPGKDIKIIFGGGRRQMGAPSHGAPDPDGSCKRDDGRDLTKRWQAYKTAQGLSNAYVTNIDQLRNLDLNNTDSILGLFAEGHLPYEIDRIDDPRGVPSLKELTEIAIHRLKRKDNGYFLMVEGGRIDHGLHDSKVRRALEDLVAFEEAVKVAIDNTDPIDTLIVVTADHSHVMTMNGYPDRGNDILGLATYDRVTDNMPYTTLMFTTGPGFNFTFDGEKVRRGDVRGVDTRDRDFIAQSAVPSEMGYETHGGEDVAAYAMGPMAHLLHRTHEQTYVAHLMAYASCIGPYIDCDRPIEDPKNVYTTISSDADQHRGSLTTTLLVAILLIMFNSKNCRFVTYERH